MWTTLLWACAAATFPDGELLPVEVVPKPVAVSQTHVADGSSTLTLDAVDVLAEAGTGSYGTRLALALSEGSGHDGSITTVNAGDGDADIELRLDDTLDVGDEGYRLVVGAERVVITARTAAGVFYGSQTLLQLLDPAFLTGTGDVPIKLPLVTIDDTPRFAWRGLMVDVARHFFSVEEIERVIDLAAFHKLNRLHLHLTDDQGWRIEIQSWPLLAEVGGATEVGGGPGGYYTQAEYAHIVAYAAERHVVVVPEIDLPGHANAILAAYPELSADGAGADPYIGTQLVDAALCLDCPDTARFVDDVIAEVAAITPGAWIHVGADEVTEVSAEAYASFVQSLQGTVTTHGKVMLGWDEIGTVPLVAPFVAQHWTDASRAVAAAGAGAFLVESPAEHAYLDMVHDWDAEYGQVWAGPVNVEAAYDWEVVPAGVDEASVLGVEGALWTEYIDSRERVDFMSYPRLCALSERGWSGAERDWDEFATRLGWHGSRLDALGVGFYATAEVPWAR